MSSDEGERGVGGVRPIQPERDAVRRRVCSYVCARGVRGAARRGKSGVCACCVRVCGVQCVQYVRGVRKNEGDRIAGVRAAARARSVSVVW